MVKLKGLSKKLSIERSKKPAASEVVPIPETKPETEHKILSAARREFVAKGLDGARMQVIATEAGVNKALLHYYYRSKEKLYTKVLEETLLTVWTKVQKEFQGQDLNAGLEPLLRTVVRTYIHTFAENPDFPLFMFREISSGGSAVRESLPPLLARFKDVPSTISKVLGEEIKNGKIKSMHPIHFFMNMMGMVVSTFLIMPMVQKLGPSMGIKIAFDEKFLEERIRIITDTLLNGIRIRK